MFKKTETVNWPVEYKVAENGRFVGKKFTVMFDMPFDVSWYDDMATRRDDESPKEFGERNADAVFACVAGWKNFKPYGEEIPFDDSALEQVKQDSRFRKAIIRAFDQATTEAHSKN